MARNRANTHVETITSQEVGSIDDVLGPNLGGQQETAENPVTGSEDNLPATDEPVEIQKETADSTSEDVKPDAVATDAGKDESEESKDAGQDANEEPEETVEKPILENLSVLADRHRLPAWQQAALLRYMGWQDDKMVSNEDYMAAMQGLKTRRIGGGRR